MYSTLAFEIMKPLIPVALLSLVLGGVVGAIALNYLSTDSSKSDTDVTTDDGENESHALDFDKLMEENASLRDKIESLKEQLEHNEDSLDSPEEVLMPVDYEPTEAQLRKLKKQWIEASLEEVDPRFQRRTEKELNRMIQELGLTPEQASEMALIFDKRDQQRQLGMMLSMGLISEEEYKMMFAEMDAFDFGLSVETILSPDQLNVQQSLQEEARASDIERFSHMVSDRLNLNDSERYSEAERDSVNSAITVALNRDAELKIPPAIRDLDLNRVEKRVLAAGYSELDEATFEKLYQSVVEQKENGDSNFPQRGRGGNRPPPRGR